MRVLGRSTLAFGILGLAVAAALGFTVPGQPHPAAPLVAAMIGLMAVYWIFEVFPIPVTSLFPLFILPLFGVSDMNTVAAYYGKPIIFLFLGGFMLAIALQESGVHKRIALELVARLGSRPSRIVLGFMLGTAFLSMWISNTAAVMVMLPICLALLEAIKEHGAEPDSVTGFACCLMLGVAYSADIGGMGTLVGTPPNLVFVEVFKELFPAAPPVGFTNWLLMGLPLSISFLALGHLILTKLLYRLPPAGLFHSGEVIQEQLSALGRLRRDEVAAAAVFCLAAILWLTGSDIQIGAHTTIQGWRTRLGLPLLTDPAVAVMTASLLYVIPSKDRPGQALLTWRRARELPWGILLLFGGGFAIAGGFETSGLSDLVGLWFSNLPAQSPWVVVLVVCTLLTFLTEFTSNTATVSLVLPILAGAAVPLNLDPRLLMIPATLSASCAFMMPVASPTQAMIFATGYVPIRQMVRAGLFFNVLGVILVTVIFVTLGPTLLGLSSTGVPDWALTR